MSFNFSLALNVAIECALDAMLETEQQEPLYLQ